MIQRNEKVTMAFDLTDEEIAALRELIALDARKPEIDAYFDALDAALEKAQRVVDFGGYFAASESAPVFKITAPEGRFVAFKRIGYDRTKRTEDPKSRASLSRKEADEALANDEVFLLDANATRNHDAARREYIAEVLDAHERGVIDALAVYRELYQDANRTPAETDVQWIARCAEQDFEDGATARAFDPLKIKLAVTINQLTAKGGKSDGTDDATGNTGDTNAAA